MKINIKYHHITMISLIILIVSTILFMIQSSMFWSEHNDNWDRIINAESEEDFEIIYHSIQKQNQIIEYGKYIIIVMIISYVFLIFSIILEYLVPIMRDLKDENTND